MRNWKLALAGIAAAIGIAGYGALTVNSSYYPIIEGDLEATVQETRGSVTYQASQSWRVEVEDGRQWWVGVPDSAVAQTGEAVRIRVSCKTVALKNCTAMYLGKAG